MSDNAQLYALITLIIMQGVSLVRDWLKRRWDVEDRAKLAQTVVLTADAVAKRVEEEAEKSAQQRKQNLEDLKEQSHNHKVALGLQIQETKEIVIEAKEASKKAEHEANTVNIKLAGLGLEHNALQKKEDRREERKELREERKDERDERRELREEKKVDDLEKK